MQPARLVTMLCVCWCWTIGASPAIAADDPIADKLTRARQQYEKAQADVGEKVLQHLDRRLESARKSGNLGMVSEIQAAREKFQLSGIMPDDVPVSYYRQSAAAHRAYEIACEAAVKSYTQSGQQEKGQRTGELLERLQKTGLERATRFDGEVRITSTREVGYDFGRINKGDRIQLKYLSGKWKGWGNVASDSPDEPVLEKGDRNRLVVCEADALGRTRVLMIVPPGTQYTPFELVADRNYERIVLRINDDDRDFGSNPDNKVTYHLRVLRGN